MITALLLAAIDQAATFSFTTSPVTGIGEEVGVCRRDPSDVIKLGGKYYVFYSKVTNDKPIYPSGYAADVWYAKSEDEGHSWTEMGEAVRRGEFGAWDWHGVFTPNVIQDPSGDLWVYYTGVGSTFDNKGNDYNRWNRTAIGVCKVRLDDDGVITSNERVSKDKPVLLPSEPETANFDSFRVDDAVLVFRENQYWMYFKGRAYERTPGQTKMGVAVADHPAGPWTKMNDGQDIQPEGHEVMAWPENGGIVSVVSNVGRGIYFAQDGLQMTKTTIQMEGRINAPGAYRPDLVNHGSKEEVTWGISMAHTGHPYLMRWSLERRQ